VLENQLKAVVFEVSIAPSAVKNGSIIGSRIKLDNNMRMIAHANSPPTDGLTSALRIR
jgi:hypothetical protein